VRYNSLTMCGTLPAAACKWSLQWNASYFIMLCLHSMLALTVVGTFFSWQKKKYVKFIEHLWPDGAHTVRTAAFNSNCFET
jgi:hypothetical protein